MVDSRCWSDASVEQFGARVLKIEHVREEDEIRSRTEGSRWSQL